MSSGSSDQTNASDVSNTSASSDVYEGKYEEQAGEDLLNPWGFYEGERNDNSERHGFGQTVYINGDYYVGYFHRGVRHGKGLYVFRSGAYYNGERYNGLKHGQGKFVYPDGSYYIGDWYKDLKQGYGTYTFKNDDVYEGAWYKDLRHGLGSMSYKKSGLKFFGTWKKDSKEGPGQLVYPQFVYHGEYKNNLPYGPGVFAFEQKCLQTGYYVHMKNPNYVPPSERVEDEEKEDYHEFDEEEEEEDFGEDKTNDSEESTDESSSDEESEEEIIAVWRPRSVVRYQRELMPTEPQEIPITYSKLSLISIIDYLEKQYKTTAYQGDNEEGEETADYYFNKLVSQMALHNLNPENPIPNPDAQEENN